MTNIYAITNINIDMTKILRLISIKKHLKSINQIENKINR